MTSRRASPTLPQRLPWTHDAEREPWAHTERAFYPPGFRFPLHRHDFAELFLVVRGPGVHRVGPRAHPVERGDLVLVHPDLAHCLEATGASPLVFINLTIRPGLHRELETRYAAAGDWPWSADDPRPLRLDGETERALGSRLAGFEAERICVDRLRLEAFLLEAMRAVREARRPRPALPAPIARALRLLDDPDGLRRGAAGLAERLGWSREHLNRQVRRHLGMTTMQLVTGRRLDHAARLLRLGGSGVQEVCHACGLDNLSHFYQIFRRRFGCTPAAFRAAPTTGAV
ncbi:MAG TPA: AraC family transcriptional regulator [Planctomycetota bacterium]|nr:AraC family transcriptional regulator [Planctomycetota bacterium]